MRLVLGDDHRMFLDALNEGLVRRGHEVVGSSDHLDDLFDLVGQQHPDLCVLDVDFGGRSVLPTVARVRSSEPGVRLVLLSGSATAEVWAAFEAGTVDGVVNKLCDLSVLDRAIERVSGGERVVERFPRPVGSGRSPSVPSPLSARERTVVSLLVAGQSTDEMARELGVTTHTVRTHVQSVLRKFGVSSRAKAVRFAVSVGVDAYQVSGARARR